MGGYLRKLFYLLALGLLPHATAEGQTLTTHLSRDSALLGDTVSFSVVASGGRGAEIFFVELPDTVAHGGELWQAPRIDTLANSDTEFAARLHLVVTSYDSGAVLLPRFGVLVRHAGVLDTMYSEPRTVFFSPVPREAGKEGIQDIRGPERQVLTFAEVWPWLLGLLIAVALIVGCWLYWRRMKSSEVVESKRRLVPPDELALDRLRRLREEKAWRTKGVKAFYTELTDTLREFITAEFGIHAMERTSGRIVSDLQADARCRREWIREIDGILHLADLTKFARFAPTEQDCLYTIDTTEGLVRSIHAALNTGEREEDEAEGSGTEGAVAGADAQPQGEEHEAEKAQRDAARYGPRHVGAWEPQEERREE